jgi:NADPH:quinone reductase-like Zn-dependent oxidoreductase
MQAIIQDRYGSPDVLRLGEIDTPAVGDGDVLIRVNASAVNIGDWHMLTGIPYVMRLGTGPRRPRHGVPGVDVAGDVEAVGAGVTRFRPGDAVFGWCHGAFAQRACAAEDHFLAKPEGVTFEQAAALGVAAVTALKAVRDQGRVREGDAVLVNGASGGVGTFAVQLAKAFGAEVTAVCSSRNAALVRSIGAHHVVDYTREDFTAGDRRYDVMLDLVGSRPLSDCLRVLTATGTYVLVGVADPGRWLGIGRQLAVLARSPVARRRMRTFVSLNNGADLAVLRDLAQAGTIAAVIDQRYALGDVPQALRHQGAGHARGRTVIAVRDADGAAEPIASAAYDAGG